MSANTTRVHTILTLAARDEGCTSRDVADALKIPIGHAAVLLRWWERVGLLASTVEPNPHARGQTRKRLTITRAGRLRLVCGNERLTPERAAAADLGVALGYPLVPPIPDQRKVRVCAYSMD